MRIWMHLLLMATATFSGFFAGGGLTALVAELVRDRPPAVASAVIVPALVAFALGGALLGEWLVRRLPARCPSCGRPAYAEGHRPIRYRCRSCGHDYHTRARTNWGRA